MFQAPLHPYAEALLSAVPLPVPGRVRQRHTLRGELPSPLDPPASTSFHPRCPLNEPKFCEHLEPELFPRPGALGDEAAHVAACHVRTGRLAVPARRPSAPEP